MKKKAYIDIKYLLCALYLVVYLSGFFVIEHVLKPTHYHILTTPVDYQIPFCEWIIFFYYAWFPYMAFSYLYTFLFDQKNYLKLITFTFSGMTIFLIVSAVYPNMLDLRPAHLPNRNIACILTNFIYFMDTPTNVLPSIHVYNSIGFALALSHSDHLTHKQKIFSNLLCFMICICVFFVKQHGIIDVLLAILMAHVFYIIVYRQDLYIFKKDYHNRYKH